MKKTEKINIEISKKEKELERLYILKENVTGNTIENCPICKSKDYHWNIDNTWTCGNC